MARALQVLVIDGHELFRAGLHHLVKGITTPTEIHEADSLADARSKHVDQAIELVLVELMCIESNGISAIDSVKSVFSNAAIVALSGNENSDFIRNAIEQGIAGYIPKSVSHSRFLAALELVIAGETFIPKQALEPAGNGTDQSAIRLDLSSQAAELTGLTQRQKATLQLAIRGATNKEIARELNIAEGTVKAHLSAAYKSLGVRNRTEAVRRFQ